MIEFKNVQINYGDFVAVKNLNLNVREGEFFTLLGPSGCGKTTTLRSLVGFVHPSQGEIFLNGENITSLPVEKREVSMVFQSYALFPTLDVYENIAFGLKVKKVPKQEIDREVRDMAAKVDLSEEQLKKKVSELSGGQQQRVAIARALVLKPRILVLDEPLSNLDARLRVQLRRELKNLQKQFGITAIYVTHDQEEALTLSDRIAVFNKGVVEQVGTPKEIYSHSETEFVCNFIGDINHLETPVVKELNEQMGGGYLEHERHYVRMERVHTRQWRGGKEASVLKLTGRVEDAEFYGVYTKYSFLVNGTVIKSIEREDGRAPHNIGDEVDIYIDIHDVMTYRERHSYAVDQ
ncbi:ABC transporter ATP-binding protein [Halobacillus kuroshimensis]|uniref:ABC transporter ATP-binding protein n=1 Tax=Halobacillus kuroshimensis TaxID=302481 RepID=A0ABS3DYV0_9BACI|nr:ABC transporter ATP-binding protein [Halobacillus sp. Cin3]MBN8236379.1 ABC transporter ATP-binding protein [Halobacillus kuroshimensis]